MERLLSVAAQFREILGPDEGNIVAAMVRNDDGLTLRERAITAKFPLEMEMARPIGFEPVILAFGVVGPSGPPSQVSNVTCEPSPTQRHQ